MTRGIPHTLLMPQAPLEKAEQPQQPQQPQQPPPSVFECILIELKKPIATDEVNDMVIMWKKNECDRNSKRAQMHINDLIVDCLGFGNKDLVMELLNEQIMEAEDIRDLQVIVSRLDKGKMVQIGEDIYSVYWLIRNTNFCEQLARCFGNKFKVIYKSVGENLKEVDLTLQFWPSM